MNGIICLESGTKGTNENLKYVHSVDPSIGLVFLYFYIYNELITNS